MVTVEQLKHRDEVRRKVLQFLVTFGDVRFADLSVSDATLDDCRALMRQGFVIVGEGSNPRITLTPEGKKKSGHSVARRKPRGAQRFG